MLLPLLRHPVLKTSSSLTYSSCCPYYPRLINPWRKQEANVQQKQQTFIVSTILRSDVLTILKCFQQQNFSCFTNICCWNQHNLKVKLTSLWNILLWRSYYLMAYRQTIRVDVRVHTWVWRSEVIGTTSSFALLIYK